MSGLPDTEREQRRQQWLLRALRGDAGPQEAADWLAGPGWQQQRGLRAYQANAAATAGRALAAAFPTVQQLLGSEAFAALAQAHWHAHPPVHGDLATWGQRLPACITTDPQLAGEPYLADVARLDWALHQAERAADDDAPVTGLPQLGSADPDGLRLRLRAGHAVLVSPHPVHTLWAAHRSTAPNRLAGAREALGQRRPEAVRVERQGLAAVATCIDPVTAAFERDLCRGLPLARALSLADPAFAFEPWLVDTLRRGALAAVQAPQT